MKGLALVVILAAAARAGVSPEAFQRSSLVGAMDARQSALAPYQAYPQIHAMAAELAALRRMARRARPAELGQVSAAFADWQRRSNVYLSGGGSFYSGSYRVVESRQAPRGYAAHPTRRQVEDFNRRHVNAKRVAKSVSLNTGFGAPSAAAVKAPRRAAPPPSPRLRPAQRRKPQQRSRDLERVRRVARRRAVPPPEPAVAERRQPARSPLAPIGDALDGVTRGVGHVIGGGAQMAGTVIGGLLRMPLEVFEGITSGFGYRRPPRTVRGHGSHFHAGVDYRAVVGTPVQAGGDGVVVRAGWYGGYGKAVIIDHGAGVQTLYGHLSVIGVRRGQRVHRGMIIAKSGATGNVTGPHLHYEVRRDGVPFNPLAH